MTTPARLLADEAVRAYELAFSNLKTMLDAEGWAYSNWKRCAVALGSNAPETVGARGGWEIACEERQEHAYRLVTAEVDLSTALRGVELEGPT